jgi:hypothetical protein
MVYNIKNLWMHLLYLNKIYIAHFHCYTFMEKYNIKKDYYKKLENIFKYSYQQYHKINRNN